MSARATELATPSVPSPARAAVGTSPIRRTPARAERDSATRAAAPARAFPYRTLASLGRTLDELERARKKVEQRIGAGQRAGDAPWKYEHETLTALVEAEHYAELDLRRLVRGHPLWTGFAKNIPGVGENLFGRLLAEIGDPIYGSHGHWRKDTLIAADGSERADRTWVVDEVYERTVSQLWAYCNFDPGRMRPRAGATQAEVLACGSTRAHTAAMKIAFQFWHTVGGNTLPHGAIARRSPYRDLIEAKKATYLARGEEYLGPDLRPGRAHMAACRYAAKEFLKDLWREGRRQQGLPVTVKRGKRGGVKHRAGQHSAAIQSPLARAGQQPGDPHKGDARAQ